MQHNEVEFELPDFPAETWDGDAAAVVPFRRPRRRKSERPAPGAPADADGPAPGRRRSQGPATGDGPAKMGDLLMLAVRLQAGRTVRAPREELIREDTLLDVLAAMRKARP